ncbi:SDR family NAD(P)-dependent oxidoreductase [Rhodococcus sp. 14-2470-1a]|uniref:SDR family NAD(P)-dependent oxidoreductase n=1 Tax=Rhodococcus sp. 14-2470-1a TaxID=2023150 RepID=UPI000B9C5A31|nr:glucose 1-dehydrogenase [Rhodococcus sp. 14-2470-1a]OZF45764.1 short-chain dehydrogenase [Rhodococcus sp. 14-2470-1a]
MTDVAEEMQKSMFDLTGKVAWVTGAGKGLGSAIAQALYDAGATVVLTSKTESDLTRVAKELDPSGSTGRTSVIAGSVDTPGFAADAVRRIVADHGQLNVLINCAGISPSFTRSERVTDEGWQRVIKVNLDGAFFCAREAGAQMLAQETGSIVNITSVHAVTGFERIAAYAASKGGLDALTKTLAVEWARRGVRVNSLAPGYFRTDLSSGLLDSKWGETIVAATPVGRLGVPSELGGAAVFLASDASSYVTGTTVNVDGGWVAR